MYILDYYKLLAIIYNEQISLADSEDKIFKINEYYNYYLELPKNMGKTDLDSFMVFGMLNKFKELCFNVLNTNFKVRKK